MDSEYCDAPVIYAFLHCLAAVFGSSNTDDVRQSWEDHFNTFTLKNGYLPHNALREISNLCSQRYHDGAEANTEAMYRFRRLVNLMASQHPECDSLMFLEEKIISSEFQALPMADRIVELRRFTEATQRGKVLANLLHVQTPQRPAFRGSRALPSGHPPAPPAAAPAPVNAVQAGGNPSCPGTVNAVQPSVGSNRMSTEAWVETHGAPGFPAPASGDRYPLHVAKIMSHMGMPLDGLPTDSKTLVGPNQSIVARGIDSCTRADGDVGVG